MAHDARNGGDGREDRRASSTIEAVIERNEGASDRLFADKERFVVDKEKNERPARRLFVDKEVFVVDKDRNE